MIERFVPGTGGVENVAWQVAHELARAGDDVVVITREAAAESSVGTGVEIERVRVPAGWQPLRVAAFSRAAARVSRRQRFDVVHGFSRTRHQDLYRAGGGSHADYLRRSHSALGAAARQLSPRHRVLLSIEGRVFADSTQRIQCASRLVADRLVEGYGVDRSRILLLPNAVDADRFGAPGAHEAGRRLRRQLDEAAERIWLFPASGWRRKGLGTLFEALTLSPDPGLRLWIAGRDADRAWQRRAHEIGIADRVRFLGPRRDLDIVYGAVDGLILPTRYDPFANVTLEAAAAGLAIVTTAANGASEWLGDAIRTIADPLDAGAFAEALADLSAEASRRALGEAAQQRARQLDWPSHVATLREEYARIVAGKNRKQRDRIR